MRWWRDGYVIDTDRGRLDRQVIRDCLGASYWARGVPVAEIDRSLDGALCFGLYRDGAQVGFTRVVTDQARFAWISDVFVLEAHRGVGLGVWLVETAMGHPALSTVRRWMLATADAHGVYARFGFAPADPGRIMALTRGTT